MPKVMPRHRQHFGDPFLFCRQAVEADCQLRFYEEKFTGPIRAWMMQHRVGPNQGKWHE